MATVYKALDRTTGALVLLKTLRPTVTDPERHRRFREEAELAAEVDHDNVVRVLRVDLERGALLAEWIEGTDLRAWLDAHGPLPPALAAFVAREAARGLAAIHAAGILHRDVSAGNVLMGYDGAVKLTDFGLASLAPDTPLEEVRGTLRTLAPEVIRGERPTVASDLFSLGAVLAHALMGRSPFEGSDASATLDAILHADPAAALAADPRIPPALAAVTQSLLHRDPARRLQDAHEVASRLTETLHEIGAIQANELAAFLEDPSGYRPPPSSVPEPPSAPPGPDRSEPLASSRSSEPRAGRRPRRSWRWAAGAAAVVLVGLVGLAIATRQPASLQRTESTDAPRPLTSQIRGDTVGDSRASGTRPLVDTSVALRSVASADPAEPQEGAGDRPLPQSPPVELEAPPRATPPLAAETEAGDEPSSEDPQIGTLAVVVEPWAHVQIDGREIGTTPFGEVSLPAGDHDITLRNPDFPTHTLRVRVQPDERTRTVVSLWDLVGRVTLEVSPWAKVTVDGELWDTVPPQSRPLVLAPGEHVLRFEHPTLGTRTQTLRIAAGEQRTVRVQMGDR